MSRPRLLTLEPIATTGSEPVTIVELKKQLEIEGEETAHDEYLDSLVLTGREAVEVLTGRTLLTKTIRIRYAYAGERAWPLLRPPFQELQSVKTRFEGDEALQDEADFFVESGLVPVLRLKSSASLSAADVDEIEITYTAGYATADAVPERIRLAIKQAAADWFEYRNSVEIGETATDELPGSVKRTLRLSGLVIPKI